MNKDTLNKLLSCPRPYLTEIEVEMLLLGTPDSRYGKVKRLIQQGKLLHLRRGLYCMTREIGYPRLPHPFELAQPIYGPSYISLESAMSYHQLIPEAVYTITSACSKRSKDFNTPLGLFSYSHLPAEYFYMGVELIIENSYHFFMAKPWKAICDYVYCYKKDWTNIDPLINSLRIDPEDLPYLRQEEIDNLDEYYHQRRLSRFLKGIQRSIIRREI